MQALKISKSAPMRKHGSKELIYDAKKDEMYFFPNYIWYSSADNEKGYYIKYTALDKGKLAPEKQGLL